MIAPTFQVIVIYDPDNKDTVTVKVIASEPIMGNALDQVIVQPHSDAHGAVDITASFSYVGDNTFMGEFPRNQGYGDIAEITVTARDLVGNVGVSDGSFEKQVRPSERKVVIMPNVIDPTRGEKAKIQIQLDHLTRVKVAVYDIRGRQIKKLVDEVRGTTFDTLWAGLNERGSIVSSGVYIVTIETDTFTETKKVIVKK